MASSTRSRRREAELDDDVGQEASAGPAARGVRDPVPVLPRARARERARRSRRRADGEPRGRSWWGRMGPCRRSHHLEGRRAAGSRISRLSAPWWTRISRPSTTVHPSAASPPPGARCRRPGRRGRPRTRICPSSSAPSGRSLNVASASWRPTAVQLTSRSAVPARRDGAHAEVGGERLGALRRPVPDRHVGGAGLAQRPGGRAGAAARAEDERAVRPRGGSGSAASRPGASVLSARIVPSRAKLSVFAAPIAARRRRRRVGEGERRLLVGDRDVRAAEAGRRQRADGLGEAARAAPAGAGSASRAPARARPAPRCASPASGCGRRASRGRRGGASDAQSADGLSTATDPCRRAPRACGCRRRRRAGTGPWSTRSCGRRCRRGLTT